MTYLQISQRKLSQNLKVSLSKVSCYIVGSALAQKMHRTKEVGGSAWQLLQLTVEVPSQHWMGHSSQTGVENTLSLC